MFPLIKINAPKILFGVCGERLLTICRMPFLARLNFESLQTCSALRSGSFRHPRGTSPFRRISGRRSRESNQWTMAAAGAADKWRRRGLAVGHSQRRPWTAISFFSPAMQPRRLESAPSSPAGRERVGGCRHKGSRRGTEKKKAMPARQGGENGGWAGLAPRRGERACVATAGPAAQTA